MDDDFLFRTKKEYESNLNHYIEEEAYEKALQYLDEIEHKVIDPFWWHYQKGLLYNQLTQYHLALPHFIKALLQSEESVSVLSEIGWTYNRMEEFDEALHYLEKCVTLGRDDYWLFSELAYSYLKLEMYEEAIIYLTEALYEQMDDPWVLRQLANAYADLKEYVKANEFQVQLFELGEDDIELVEDIVILNELNETFDSQTVYLDYLIDELEDKSFGYYHYGIYSNYMHQYEEAISYLELIEEAEMDAMVHLEIGYSLRQCDVYEEALTHYLIALEHLEQHPFLLSELAFVYGIFEEYEYKVHYLDQVFALGRNDLWVYLNYIRTYLYGLKDFELAKKYIDEANDLFDDEELDFLLIEYYWLKDDKIKAQTCTSLLLKRRGCLLNMDEAMIDFSLFQRIDVPCLERVYEFSEGLAYVEVGDYCGFIDTKGRLVIDLQYAADKTKRQDTYMFKNNRAVVCFEENHLFGMINTQGEIIEEMIYDNIIIESDHVRKELGHTTTLVFENQVYTFTKEIKQYKEGILGVLEDQVWQYQDLNGKSVIDGYFDEVTPFYNGEAIVCLEGLFGVIDINGNYRIECSYEDLKWCQNHLIAKKEEVYGVIDKMSRVIIPFRYESIEDGHLGYIAKKEKYGFLSEENEVIIPFEYDEIIPYFSGLARVKKDQFYGMLDTKGNIMMPIVYDTLTICKNHFIIAGIGYRYAYFDEFGCILTPFIFQTGTLPVDGRLVVSFQEKFYIVREEMLCKK